MIKHAFPLLALSASLIAAPASAANGPVTDRDLRCFVLMAVTETAFREQLKDPKTAAEERNNLIDVTTQLRKVSDWYLARISTLPAEKRTVADFNRASSMNKGMNKESFDTFFNGCMKDVDTDRVAAVERLLN